MGRRWRAAGRRAAGLATVGAAAAVVLMVWAGAAQARPDGKFALGFGLASRSVSGDLDGQRIFFADPTNGPFVHVGEPENGGGGTLMGAVQLNENVALEALLTSTTHDATHAALPGETFEATIATLMVGARMAANLGDAFDVFARLGVGPMVASYVDNTTLPPNPVRQDSDFSGLALGAGAGFAVYLDPFGFELGVARQSGRLDSLSAAGTNGEISSLDVDLNTVTFIVSVHFGG